MVRLQLFGTFSRRFKAFLCTAFPALCSLSLASLPTFFSSVRRSRAKVMNPFPSSEILGQRPLFTFNRIPKSSDRLYRPPLPGFYQISDVTELQPFPKPHTHSFPSNYFQNPAEWPLFDESLDHITAIQKACQQAALYNARNDRERISLAATPQWHRLRKAIGEANTVGKDLTKDLIGTLRYTNAILARMLVHDLSIREQMLPFSAPSQARDITADGNKNYIDLKLERLKRHDILQAAAKTVVSVDAYDDKVLEDLAQTAEWKALQEIHLRACKIGDSVVSELLNHLGSYYHPTLALRLATDSSLLCYMLGGVLPDQMLPIQSESEDRSL